MLHVHVFRSPDVGALILEGTFYNPDIGCFDRKISPKLSYGCCVHIHKCHCERSCAVHGVSRHKVTIFMQVVVVLVALYYLREEIDQMLDPWGFFTAPKLWYLTTTRKSVWQRDGKS